MGTQWFSAKWAQPEIRIFGCWRNNFTSRGYKNKWGTQELARAKPAIRCIAKDRVRLGGFGTKFLRLCMKHHHIWIFNSCVKPEHRWGHKGNDKYRGWQGESPNKHKNQTNISWHLKTQKARLLRISRNFCPEVKKTKRVRENEGCASPATCVWLCRDATRVQPCAVLSKELLIETCGSGKSRTKMSAKQNAHEEGLLMSYEQIEELFQEARGSRDKWELAASAPVTRLPRGMDAIFNSGPYFYI